MFGDLNSVPISTVGRTGGAYAVYGYELPLSMLCRSCSTRPGLSSVAGAMRGVMTSPDPTYFARIADLNSACATNECRNGARP